MGDGGQVFNLENQRSNHSNGLFGHRVAEDPERLRGVCELIETTE